MTIALAVVLGAALASGLIWFGWWLLFAPMDAKPEPTEHQPHDPFGRR